MTRQTVRKTVYCGDWPFPWNTTVSAVVDWLNEQLGEIPEPYRATACCEIASEMEWDVAVLKVTISYERPETDDETALRERKEELDRTAKMRQELAIARQTLAKYGVKE